MKGHITANYVQSWIVLSTGLITCLWLFSRSHADPSTKSWSYSPSESASLPSNTLWYLMLTPIVYLELFPQISLKTILVSWSIAVAWISVCIYVYNAYNTLILFMFYIPTSLLFIYKKQSERHLSLLEKETYQARIEEMEIQSVNNNKEMKNVTHDMKTVNMLFDFNNLIACILYLRIHIAYLIILTAKRNLPG